MARHPKSRPTRTKTPSTTSAKSSQPAPTAAEQGLIDKLLQQQNYQQAQLAAKTLTQKYPTHPFGWLKLGRALLAMEQWEASQVTLEKTLQLTPRSSEALAALGYAYLKQNETARAIHHMEQALAIDPTQRIALIGISRALFSTGNYAEVIKHCEHILKTDPASVPALVLKSTSLARMTKIQEALYETRKALSLHPNNFDLNNNIANLYLLTGEPAKAEEHYRKAWNINPDNDTALSNIYASMHYNPGYQASDFLATSLEWEKHFRIASRPQRASTAKIPDRKVRIGLISSGFSTHPVGQMITSALENLPKDTFELYAYATNDRTDTVTKKIQQIVHSWQLIEHFSQQALAERVRQDQIDILIDLNGPGEGSCYKAVASEPAPIQIKWVGCLINTTGLRAFDYLLSDSVETPEGSDSFYCEKLIRMPDDYICYTPPEYTPSQTSLPALVNGYITFGCLNNPAKLNRQLLAQWAELMHELPNSRLLLKGQQYKGEEFCDSIRASMAEYGISADRLILEGPANHQDFLATYNRIDIALDTWPYSGGLTTCEAMLMGVPVVTMPGPTFAGRHSATHLINAGMPELVTHNWDEYRQRVIGLASDLPNLAIIRACLRTILLQSPVCDGPRFGKHLTTALRAIWQRHCEGKAPAALYLDKEGQAYFEGMETPVQILPIATQTGNEQALPFQWKIEGQIITLDNGALLVSDPQFADLQQLGTFATVAFDPTGKVTNAAQLQANGELHHYPHVTLGDGQEATLFACLDPAMSATLEPLPAEQQLPGTQEATQVIAKLPINTLRLDDIEGLESIDWLLLDNLNDSLAILENGEKALNSTLLVQARVNFSPSHENQPQLHRIGDWLSHHGFSFYRLNNLQHYSHLPARDDLCEKQATQLICADALFIPNSSRMAVLTDNQRLKLAFVLHTVYGSRDLSFALLEKIDPESALTYLKANALIEVNSHNGDQQKKTRPIEKPSNDHQYKNQAPALLKPAKSQQKIFVGVPVYNEEQYIEETINSLKNQSVDGAKYLISDNQSTDRTFEIIKDTIGDDERFEIFQQSTNLGSFENFKFVFENTQSEYFLWLGAHDRLSADYLESTSKVLDNDQSVSMACGVPYAIFNSEITGPVESAVYEFSEDSPKDRYIKSAAILSNCTVFHSLFRRKHLNDFNFKKVISCDHVIISHLLWHGKLAYPTNAKYYRRYFEAREESYEERLAGKGQEIPRSDFYKLYEDDFLALARHTTDQNEATAQARKIQDILISRFN